MQSGAISVTDLLSTSFPLPCCCLLHDEGLLQYTKKTERKQKLTEGINQTLLVYYHSLDISSYRPLWFTCASSSIRQKEDKGVFAFLRVIAPPTTPKISRLRQTKLQTRTHGKNISLRKVHEPLSAARKHSPWTTHENIQTQTHKHKHAHGVRKRTRRQLRKTK